MQYVHAYADGVPRGVHQTLALVLEGKLLKAGDVWLFGQCLCVVRDGSCYWISHHHNEFGVLGHTGDAAWSLTRYIVAGCFLHGDLTVQCSWH